MKPFNNTDTYSGTIEYDRTYGGRGSKIIRNEEFKFENMSIVELFELCKNKYNNHTTNKVDCWTTKMIIVNDSTDESVTIHDKETIKELCNFPTRFLSSIILDDNNKIKLNENKQKEIIPIKPLYESFSSFNEAKKEENSYAATMTLSDKSIKDAKTISKEVVNKGKELEVKVKASKCGEKSCVLTMTGDFMKIKEILKYLRGRKDIKSVKEEK